MMAFSRSIKKGQIPINCRLCEIETKITSKCIECDLLMCTKCKEKIHPKFRNAKNHRIVDIKDVGLHTVEVAPEELDFTNIPCHNHSGQISCVFCKSCGQSACPQCISKVHNGHALVDMKEGYKIQLEKLEAMGSKVEKVLDEARDKEHSIEKVKKTEKNKYQDIKKGIQDHNILLKKAVDQYTNKLLTKLDQDWDDLENATSKVKQVAIARQKDLTEKMLQINYLKESPNTEKVFSEIENITKSLDSEYESLELKVDPIPAFVPGEISQYNVGQLHQSPSIAKFTVSKCFTTKLETVHHISVNPDGSIWINNFNQQLLLKVKPVGDNLGTLASYNINVFDIALTPSNDILLNTGKFVLQMISNDRGQLMDTNYTISPLIEVSVHVTRDHKIIIGAKTEGKLFPVSGRRVVVVMDTEGKDEITYEHDKNGEPLFSYPEAITSTRNGNVFVIDKFSEDGESRLVILQQTGDVVNIYRGHPDINKVQAFKPFKMACSPSDDDIVTVLGTESNVIHILNNTGYLIKYCNMNDVGISYTYSLAFSRSGKLYIGCTTKEGSTENNAKLYEVNISGF